METDRNDYVVLDTSLPTQEEYEAQIEEVQKTKLGSIFPLIKSEIPRVLLACITYFTVGYVYAFLRQFKDTVLFDVLTPSASLWLKIVVFFSSFWIINITNKFFMWYGINKGTDMYIFFMAGLFFIFSGAVFIKDFVNPKGALEQSLNGNVFVLRKLGVLSQIAPLVNHFIMVLFYVFFESFGSTLMSFVFMTYLNSKLTPSQMSRYIRPVYISANLSLLATSISVSTLVKKTEKYFTAKYKFVLYGLTCMAVSIILMLVYLLKKMMDRAFDQELYQGASQSKGSKKKSKAKIGMLESIKLVYNSRLLLGMTVMSLGYNFSSNIGSTVSKYVYKAYTEFLIANPHMNEEVGFDPKNIPYIYNSKENIIVSLVVIFLMLTPAFSKLFQVFGVFAFALVTLLCCLFSSLSSTFFAAMNYPFTNFNKKIMFGISIPAKQPHFKLEAVFAMLSNLMIKIGKYAFYDIVKENVSARIDPADRALYKGVFDGVASKGGKMLGSIIGLILTNITGVSDIRYSTPAYAVFIGAICVGWFFCILDLHANYKNAVATNGYMKDSFSRKKKLDIK